MHPVTHCLEDATLARYSSGELDDAVADVVNEHLSECPRCLGRLEEISLGTPLPTPCPGPANTPRALDRAVASAMRLHPIDCLSLPRDPVSVGGYTILEELGRGGMGQVFRATHPRLNVEVALKLLRPGYDASSYFGRFESERAAISRMDHPNIAKVYDAGLSDDGRPYLVMEYVRGTTFTKFLTSQPLPLRDRLELFRRVCSAIHHAHQKGIIHRDIKPSNILIARAEGEFVPKVIDFGVARDVDANATRHTRDGNVVGTVQYMSPEQTTESADGVDIRTDVFSLGVLLYELLTGQTPVAILAGKSRPDLEVMRIIRDVEPPPASHHAIVEFPSSRVRDEVDWILLKCLEKEPAGRYQSAFELAEDVGRLLADEPVAAAPPSRRYRLRKFVRRNRGAVVAGVLVFLALCAGIVGTTWQLFRAMNAESLAESRATRALKAEADAEEKRKDAETQRTIAKQERDKATGAERQATAERNRAVEAEADSAAFNKFLVDYVLAASRPGLTQKGLGRSVTLAEALTIAEAKIDEAFANRPGAEVKARIALGHTWNQHSRHKDAEKNYLRAIEILQRKPIENIVLVLEVRSNLIRVYERLGKLEQARDLGEQLVPLFTLINGPRSENTLTTKCDLGSVYIKLGVRDKGLKLLREVMVARTELYGAENERTLTATHNYALGLRTDGKYSEALEILEKVLKIREDKLTKDHRETIITMNSVACMLKLTNRTKEAVAMFEDALPRAKVILGDDHSMTLSIQSNLGLAYAATKGRATDAIRILEENLKSNIKAHGLDHIETYASYEYLATAYAAAARYDDAIRMGEQSYRGRLKRLTLDHYETRKSGYNLGSNYFMADRIDEAIPVLEKVAAAAIRHEGPTQTISLRAVYLLSQSYILSKNQPEKAKPWLEQVLSHAESAAGRKTDTGIGLLVLQGHVLVREKRFMDAEPYLRLLIPKDHTHGAKTLLEVQAFLDLAQCDLTRKDYEAADAKLKLAKAFFGPMYREGQIGKVLHSRLKEDRQSLYNSWGKPLPNAADEVLGITSKPPNSR